MSDKKRILLIDNEEGLCRMMEQVLLDNGYLARGYTSPRKAVEEFRAGAWDLVISDIKMPGDIDGIGLYHWVRHERPALARRFLFVTGDVHDPALTGLLEASPDRFITKPFQVRDYLEVVRGMLERDAAADCA